MKHWLFEKLNSGGPGKKILAAVFWVRFLATQSTGLLRCYLHFARAKRSTAPARPGAGVGALQVHLPARNLGRRVRGELILTGLERYVFELAAGICPRDDLDVAVYASDAHFQRELFAGTPAASCLTVVPEKDYAQSLAARLAPRGAGLFHLPYVDLDFVAAAPVFWSRLSVVTIHDVIPLVRDGYMSRGQKKLYVSLLRRLCRKAGRIIVDSEHTLKDLEVFCPGASEKTSVVPLAVDRKFQRASAAGIERVRAKYDLAPDYVLTLGRAFPHKNFPFLVRTMKRVRQETGRDCQLVIVGPKDNLHGAEELGAAIRQEDAAGWVRWVGQVDDADLTAIYSGATVFAFPSLYEGFGLPVLEAMACGVPVVASDATCVPEVVGDAGVLADATDEGEFAAALVQVLSDNDLRSSLVERGRLRAEHFTWQRTAAATVEVYQDAAGRR